MDSKLRFGTPHNDRQVFLWFLQISAAIVVAAMGMEAFVGMAAQFSYCLVAAAVHLCPCR